MSPDEPRPAWLQPLRDPRNETILAAAFDIFEKKGLHGATMLEIATAARVSKETLYARFDSKEGLFYALLAWGSGKAALNPETYDEAALADPVRALNDYAVACFDKMMQPEAIAVHRIVVGEATRMPEVARVFDEFSCQLGKPIIHAIADALTGRGLADIPDKDAFMDAFIGLLRGNLHHHVVIGVEPFPSAAACEAHARRAVTLLLRAFSPAVSQRVAA